MRLATLNLLHFAEPGVFWFRRADDQTHTPAGWAAKIAWLRGLLADLDADLFCFQEVVSVAALEALCRDAGYPHFAAVEAPRFDAGDGAVYVRAVQAVAARTPFVAEPLQPPSGFAAGLGLPATWAFRRAPVLATLEAPEIGPLKVACCHLKSNALDLGGLDLSAGLDWADKTRLMLEATSRAHVAAAMQRGAEASALYHWAARQSAVSPSPAIAVLGDFNDTPDSRTLQALTPGVSAVDGVAAAALPGEARAALTHYRLYDAYRLTPKDPHRDARPATHRAGASGEVLDYVLVSDALNPANPARRATVASHRVFDAHFRRGVPEETSDHAAVVVDLERR